MGSQTSNGRLVWLIAALLFAGVACGREDPPSGDAGNDGNGGDAANDGGFDAGNDGGGDAGTNNATDCTDDDDCAGVETCDIDSGECLDLTLCGEDNPDRPTRCDEDAASFQRINASVVSHARINNSFVSVTHPLHDEPCCFDFGGEDEDPDNGIGFALEDFGILEDQVNGALADTLRAGDVLFVLEHDGLADPLPPDSGTTPFTTHFYLGRYSGEFSAFPGYLGAPLPVEIEPVTVAEGTQAYTWLENLTMDDTGLVTAEADVFRLRVKYFAVWIDLPIRQLQLEATLSEQWTDISSYEDGTGVRLVDGKIGGVIKFTDIYDMANEVAASDECDCLDTDETLVTDYDDQDFDSPTCNPPDSDQVTCRTDAIDGNGVCQTITEFCPLVSLLVSNADVDTDGDGTNDAISFGMRFEMSGAKIEGVASP